MYEKKSEPKPPVTKEKRKSIVVVPSGTLFKAEEFASHEETEIVAQVTVPNEKGYWAWVVLVAAFFNILILDACVFTWGALLPDIAKSLAIKDSLAATINSVQVGFYFTASPIASALINRYGFRTVGMIGAITCSFGTFASYFSNDVVSVMILYACVTGFGCSLICMTSGLIVGFYFEKLRSIALAIVSSGSSVGIMLMYPINNILVKLAGWKTTILLFSGFYGLVYFFSLTFRPLLSVTVTKVEGQGDLKPVRTVTYLPSASQATERRESTARRATGARRQSTAKPPSPDGVPAGQRVFGTVSNAYFPTAAAVVQEQGEASQPSPTQTTTSTPGSSVPQASRLLITTQSGINQRQLQQLKSKVSRSNVKDVPNANVEIDVDVEEHKTTKFSCCGHCCHWESHASESRPMYKDDVFYNGKIQHLPAYQRSEMGVPEHEKTGLEYQMAVTRAVTVADMNEKVGIMTTAVRRVLATMWDPRLLRKKSFMFFCLSGFCAYVGVLVPYVFMQDRNLKAGVDPIHCTYFVSVLSFTNLIGKLVLNGLSMKFDALAIYGLGLLVSGVSTMLSGLSYTLIYQYTYSAVFGFGISVITCIRSVVIVSIYGLEALTNATGIIVMFIGIGNMFSTPLAAILKDKYGYDVAFYMSGIFLILSGLAAVPMRFFVKREAMAAAAQIPVKTEKI